jgi:glyoxylase-like metal-dependent hydrolase (beta-lactamase superfamily II)
LVREGNRTILLETGIGAFFSPKMRERFGVVEERHVLLDSLAEVGVQPSDVDIIVLSHLHFDHAGGLLQPYAEGAEPALAFPQARVVVGAEAWERSKNPHFRDRASFIPELGALLEASGNIEVVEGEECDLLGDGFRFHHSSGHTPGMMLTGIDMPDGPVVFAADLIPGTPWVHLPITMGYDRFPELLIDEKSKLLESLVERHGRLFFTHDSTCAMSALNKDERGRYATCAELPTFQDLRA